MTRLLASEGGIIPTHTQVTVFGLTFNLDTIWATAVAGAIVIGLGLYMRARISHGVPGKLQLFWETIVDLVDGQVRANIGPVAPFVVPLAVTLFVFILVANYIEIVPTMGYVPSPTADINLPAAMAVFVIVLMHVMAVRKRGVRKYLKHYTEMGWAMTPLNIFEELVKPVSLSLRLFGNIFASTLMLAVIAFLFPVYVIPFGHAAWKLFALFIGAMQAFIFALLVIIYFGFMVGEEH